MESVHGVLVESCERDEVRAGYAAHDKEGVARQMMKRTIGPALRATIDCNAERHSVC